MTVLRRRRLLLVALLAIGAFLAAYGITRGTREDRALPSVPRPSVPAVVSALDAAPTVAATVPVADAPTAAGVRREIASSLGASGLGGRLLARIVDARTGAVLYDRGGSTPAAPASTAKLLTAAAVLAVHPVSTRFATRIEDAGNGTIVLVGGGDPTLSAVSAGKPTVYPGAARLTDLVAQLRAAKVVVRRIVVDSSLFAGPSISPDWDPADIGTSYGSGITALMVDGGRAAPTDQARSAIPDLSAGAQLARLLGNSSLPVTQGTAPAGARTVATVESAPLSELVEEMLQNSDNTIADVLARQVAVAERTTASFTGAAAAIRTVLARFGVQVGSGMKDGSGLSSDDRVSPAALVGVLRLVAGTSAVAGADQVRFVASALPVGGWSGTLADRYTSGSGAALAGLVRAKTGTLSGVSSLAGFVHDSSGRLLVFSFDADRAVGTAAADAALDAIVVALGKCGCR